MSFYYKLHKLHSKENMFRKPKGVCECVNIVYSSNSELWQARFGRIIFLPNIIFLSFFKHSYAEMVDIYSYVFIVASNYLNLLSDFDECNLNLDNCHEDAFCNNTRTHFECHCKPGFLGDGTSCTGKPSAFSMFVATTNHVIGCHFLSNILSQKCPDKVIWWRDLGTLGCRYIRIRVNSNFWGKTKTSSS